MRNYLTFLAVCGMAATVHAGETLRPIIGEPLRHAAVTRGPDGRVFTSNQSFDYNCPAPGAYIYPVHVDLKSNPPIIEHQFEHKAGVRRMGV